MILSLPIRYVPYDGYFDSRNTRLTRNNQNGSGEIIMFPMDEIINDLGTEVENLTEIAAQKATRCDELYEALENIHREALDYQERTGNVVTWCDDVGELLAKGTKK